MKNELISVIIACYNAELYIDECLDSIITQSYSNIEIIICDDASTDGSYSILEKWKIKDSRIILLRNEKNLFQATSRNSCINLAKGKYILIHDIDDLSAGNRIEVLLSNLLKNNVSFVSSSMATIDDQGKVSYDKILKHKKWPNKYDFLWNVPFNHPATLFLTDEINKVNGYRVDKETKRGEDYDMFMRLYSIGAKGMNVDEPLYLYRLDSDNYKRRTFTARIDECKIRYKGFKKLNILIIGFPFVFKPLLVHFTKRFIEFIMKLLRIK